MIFDITLSEFLVVFVILLVVLVFFKSRRKTRLPPGPWALPLLGNVLQLDMRKPYKTIIKWANEYGPIYTMKMGTEDTIVLNDFNLVRELLSDTASTGRTMNPIFLQFTKGSYGVLNTDGHHWESTRKFTVRTLRDLGFMKNSMEVAILEEVRAVLQMFREKEATPISGTRIFDAPVVNSLWHIVTGQRCEWEIPGAKSDVLDGAVKLLA